MPESLKEKFIRDMSYGPIDPEDPMYRMIVSAVKGFNSYLPQPELMTKEKINKWEMHVLVFLAGKSTINDVKEANERANNEILSPKKIIIIPEATHSLPMEFPDLVAETMIKFLEN